MRYYNPWRYRRSHMEPEPSLPNPLPRLHAQRIVLSDGSTFTHYTTAPTPAIVRLTRDVTNNPLWAPGTEKRGLNDDEDGRVGRFKRRFEGMDFMGGAQKGAEEEVDLSWMEGGRAEQAPQRAYKKSKGGKR